MYCYNDKKNCCVTKKYSLVIVTKRNLTKNICYQTKYFVILTEWYQQYFTFPTVIYNRGKVLESAQEISKISRCFVLWEP